jgi:hypothetical protein
LAHRPFLRLEAVLFAFKWVVLIINSTNAAILGKERFNALNLILGEPKQMFAGPLPNGHFQCHIPK